MVSPTLSQVVTNTLSHADHQGFYKRGSSTNSSDCCSGGCGSGPSCCYVGGGGGGGDGKACLIVLALLGIVVTVGSSLIVSGVAVKSGAESAQQASGLRDAYDVTEPEVGSTEEVVLDKVKKMRWLMLQERSCSALGQGGIATAFLFFTMALAYYVNWKLKVDQGIVDPRATTWAMRGVYGMIGGAVLYGATKMFYAMYSENKIRTLGWYLQTWKKQDEDEAVSKKPKKSPQYTPPLSPRESAPQETESDLPPSYHVATGRYESRIEVV